MPLIAACALLLTGAAIATVLHGRLFPLDEPRRELRLDEHLHELAASRRTEA